MASKARYLGSFERFYKKNGADERTWTSTPYGTRS